MRAAVIPLRFQAAHNTEGSRLGPTAYIMVQYDQTGIDLTGTDDHKWEIEVPNL